MAGAGNMREIFTGVIINKRQKAEISKEIKRVIDLKDDGCHNCSVKDCRIYSSGKKCGNWHGYIQGAPFDEEKIYPVNFITWLHCGGIKQNQHKYTLVADDDNIVLFTNLDEVYKYWIKNIEQL
jgi:hypothetical protein